MSPRLAISSSFTAIFLGGVASTMAANEPVEPRRTYNLPSGDASTTLRQFAGLLGRQVLFLTDKVRGEQTNALAGNYTPREALDRMLANTNLVAIEDKEGAGFVVSRRPTPVSPAEVRQKNPKPPQTKPEAMNPSKTPGKLRTWLAHLALVATTAATAQQSQEPEVKKPQDEVLILSAFTVTATSDVGYGSLMNTSGRLAKPYQDVPQMANVVTSEFLQDMKRFDTFGALTYVPGVTASANTVQGVTMRGLGTTTHFTDGFMAPGVFNGAVNDVAFTDRVEVVKGPAPGSFGRGDPAGFVNYVTKDPTFRRSTDLDVMVGTGNDDRITQRYMVDTNGLLTDDGKTAYRVVAVHSKGAEAPSFTDYENSGVLLSLKRILPGRGSLSVKGFVSSDTTPGTLSPLYFVDEHFRDARLQFDQDVQAGGIAQYPLLDRNTWLAYDSSHSSSRTFSTTAVLDYTFNEHWSTRQAAKFLQSQSDSDFLYNGAYKYDTDGVTVLSTPVRGLWKLAYRSSGYQSDFVGRYKIPSIDCALELLAGGDYSFTKSRYALDVQFPTPQPLASWNPSVPLPGWSFNPDQQYYQEARDDSSVYGQLEAKFWHERLRLTGSLRKNFTKLHGVNVPSGQVLDSKTESPLLPAYSVLFKITEALSVYALHSQYIEPPSTQLIWSRLQSSHPDSQLRGVFQPKTNLTEIGLKGNMMDGRLGFSVCVYDLTQSGAVRYSEKSHPAANDATGLAAFANSSDDGAKGLEFELFGKVTNKLTYMLNGSYIFSSHTRNVFNPPGGQASIITNKEIATNPNTISGYATYSFAGNRRRGLALTAGWKTIFSGWEVFSAALRETPYPDTQTVVDLGITYGYNDRCQFYLKGNNVFERAFVSTGEMGVIFGRKVMAGVTVHF